MIRFVTKAKNRKPQEEQRLIVQKDPANARVDPLKTTRTANLKAEFDAAHKDGMAAEAARLRCGR
jgi:hypothetical protein